MKALKKEADERLLIEAAQKDPARFADLYELNFERVYAYCVKRVQDRAESEDLTLAARNALINMIDYIAQAYSFTREQAYCLASVAVDLRISQVVDVPNMTVSAVLPLDIFER